MYNYYIYIYIHIQFIPEHFLIRYANNEVIYLFSIQNVDNFLCFGDIKKQINEVIYYFKESLYTHKTLKIKLTQLITNNMFILTSAYTSKPPNLRALSIMNPVEPTSSSEVDSPPRYTNMGAAFFAPPQCVKFTIYLCRNVI